MAKRNQKDGSVPAAVAEIARRIGANISLARRRRRLRQEDLALKAGMTRVTLQRVEAGELGTGLGAYLKVLWALGLDRDLERIASAETDREGATLEAARSGRRIRPARGMDDDF